MLTCKFEDGGDGALRHVVVQVLVMRNKQILLTRRAKELLEGGKWSLAGGFVDRDETVAQAATREVLEETGWQSENLKFLNVIDEPNRPNDAGRQNIAFNFVCNAVEQTSQPDWEVTEQQWFDLDKLPPADQIAFDHQEIIENYRNEST